MKDPKRDQDAERLRALLTAATPHGPDEPDRAGRVVARGRRDRRRLVTAGVVGVVAAAVIIIPQFLNGARTSDMRNNVTNQPTSTATQQDEGSLAMTSTPCPDDHPTIPDDVTTDQVLPDDTASVRLCVVNLAGSGQAAGWNPPVDALTVKTGAFLAAVAGLPAVGPGRCDAIRVAPDPYLLLVGSGDGGSEDQRVFVSNTCNDITLDGVAHESGAVLDAFFDALAKQRSTALPDARFGLALSSESGCARNSDRQLTRGPRISADTRFSALVACDVAASEDGITDLNAAWPAATRDLHQESAEEVDRCPMADVDAPPSYAVTTWGDIVRFDFRGCGNYIVGGYAIGDDPAEPAVARDVQFLPDTALTDELGLL